MTDTLVGRREFNKWFSETFADADGRFAHMLRWLKADLRTAWNEASKRSAAEIERLTRDVHLMGLERDRIARNRDMWKDQCERQSAQLTELHATESSLSEAVKAEREACAKVADAKAIEFLSPEYATGQPFSSFNERFACEQVASAIRSRAAVLDSGRGSTQKERSE